MTAAKPQAAKAENSGPSSGRGGYARSRDTRARILAAALAEASESGFYKTSVAKIAARAGVAVGNLHYHFGSRQELLRELMVSLVSDLLSRLHVADPDPNADFFARERAGLLVFLEYLRANPAYVRLADEVKLHDPELYRRAVARWVERYLVRIRAGIDEGTLRPMSDGEIVAQAHFLLGARHHFDQMISGADGRPYPGDDVVVDAYMSLVRGGLQPAAADDSNRVVDTTR